METQPITPAVIPYPRWHLHILAVLYLLPLICFIYLTSDSGLIFLVGIIPTGAAIIALYSNRYWGWWLATRMPYIPIATIGIFILRGLYARAQTLPTIYFAGWMSEFLYAALLIPVVVVYALGSLYLKSPRAQALYNK